MRKNSNQPKVLTFLVVLTLLGTSLLIVSPSSANGNNVLAQFNQFTLQGDVTSSGVGLRSTGTGDIQLNGIPVGAQVYKAYLYWATIGSANTYNAPRLNGIKVSGNLIGRSGNTCWANAQHNFVYRADVSSLVNGNGTYTISGLPQSLANGNDSQGASLVVIYSDSAQPYRTIVIDDGAVTLDISTQSYTDTLTGFTASSPVTDAHVTYIVGDGETQWISGPLTFNGTVLDSNVFNGSEGPYWDTVTFDVTSLSPSAPSTTTINDAVPNNPDSPDCLLWAATVLSVTSPQPGQGTNTLTQSSRFFIHGDVTSAGIGLRGTGSGALTISGVPIGSGVIKAFLYWATIGSANTFTSPTLNGNPVNGNLIGTSANTCWPNAQNNFVYRADVTSLVPGNGTYMISGLPSSLATTGNDSQGASLVILFAEAANRPIRTILIDDGAVTLDLNTQSYTDTLTSFTPNNPVGEAHITYLIGDGQSTWSSGQITFNNVSIGDNVFNGVDGNYWGDLTFDVTALSPADPSTTTISDQDPNNPQSPDCLLWAATLFSITAPQPNYTHTIYFPMTPR